MSIVTRPNVNAIWASDGSRDQPSTEIIEQGWVQEIPPHERANWIEYRQDLGLKYLFQEGISEWSSLTTYRTNSLVKYDGVVYISTTGVVGDGNVSKQPDTNPENWKIAFTEHGAYDDVVELVRRIRQEEGFLDLYVSKLQPYMEGTPSAPRYFSRLLSGSSYSVGREDTGLGLNDNGDVSLFKNGNVKAKVTDNMDINSNDETVVTTAMIKVVRDEFNTALLGVLGRVFPVGISIITQDSRNPAEYYGFGTWELDVQGRALVGVSNNPSDAPFKKFANSEFGEDEVTLTIDQMPKHSHDIPVSTTSSGSGSIDANSSRTTTTVASNEEGGDQPHNNMQKSQTKFIWTRVA